MNSKFWDCMAQARKLHKLGGYGVYDKPEELLSIWAELCFIYSLEYDASRLALTAACHGVKGLLLERIGVVNSQETFETLKELAILRPYILIEWWRKMHYSDAMEKARNLLERLVKQNKCAICYLVIVTFHLMSSIPIKDLKNSDYYIFFVGGSTCWAQSQITERRWRNTFFPVD